MHIENSLAVQWLGLCASTAGGTGSIPGRELRSRMLRGTAKKRNYAHYLFSFCLLVLSLLLPCIFSISVLWIILRPTKPWFHLANK